jgi:succinoglycan biosynthesis protein ExoA
MAALFRQYRNIGRGRARNFLKHRKDTKIRHLILVGVAPAVSLLLLAPLSFIFAAPVLVWASLCLSYGLLLGVRLRDLCSIAAGVAAITMQAGWSFGFFEELKARLPGCQHMNGTTTHTTPTKDRIT